MKKKALLVPFRTRLIGPHTGSLQACNLFADFFFWTPRAVLDLLGSRLVALGCLCRYRQASEPPRDICAPEGPDMNIFFEMLQEVDDNVLCKCA